MADVEWLTLIGGSKLECLTVKFIAPKMSCQSQFTSTVVVPKKDEGSLQKDRAT